MTTTSGTDLPIPIGSQYTAGAYRRELAAQGTAANMSATETAYDNAAAESSSRPSSLTS